MITIMLRRTLLTAAFIAALVTSNSGATSRGYDLGYDPQADAFEQYHQAVAQAEAQRKLVLVIAGGDWCRWCHVLNRFVTRNADIETALNDAFVVVKVYVGDENYNEFFFSQLPEARGAPHFWVISPDRNVLSSQSTGAFEHGKNTYDKNEFLAFIDHWKRHAASSAAH